MQVTVSARHGHLNEEHQAQVREKAEKLLHFFDRLTMIQVTVDLHDAGGVAAEVVATAEHDHEFVGQGQAADVVTAVCGAVEKARHQIQHYKEKIQDHRRDPSHGGTGPTRR